MNHTSVIRVIQFCRVTAIHTVTALSFSLSLSSLLSPFLFIFLFSDWVLLVALFLWITGGKKDLWERRGTVTVDYLL